MNLRPWPREADEVVAVWAVCFIAWCLVTGAIFAIVNVVFGWPL